MIKKIKNSKLLRHDINLLIIKGKIDKKESIVIIEHNTEKKLLQNNESKDDIYKYRVICPINKKLLKKLSSKLVIVKESSKLYWDKIDNYVNNLLINGNINWISEILYNKSNKNIIYQDEKFILLRDIIWDGTNIDNLYILGIPKNSSIRSIRDLTEKDIPLLEYMYEKIVEVLKEKWNIKKEEMYYFFHYHPSFYYLHMHICRVNHPSLQSKFLRPHLLDKVIDDLKKDRNYYHNCNMHYEIPMNHNIYKNYFSVNK